jgi:hypothetical protein
MNHSKDEFRDLIQRVKSADVGRDVKREKINEAASANISLSGDSAAEVQQLMQMFKNAGMENAGELASTIGNMPPAMDDSPCDGGCDGGEPGDIGQAIELPMKKSLPALADDMEASFDEDGYDNAPDEDYKDSEFMNNTLAGGINRPKKSFAPSKLGDSPMAVEDDEQYESIKSSLYNSLKSLMSEDADETRTGNELIAYNAGVKHGKKSGSKIGDINVSDEYGPTGSDFLTGFSAGKKQATNEAQINEYDPNDDHDEQVIQDEESREAFDEIVDHLAKKVGKPVGQDHTNAALALINDADYEGAAKIIANTWFGEYPTDFELKIQYKLQDELEDLEQQIGGGPPEPPERGDDNGYGDYEHDRRRDARHESTNESSVSPKQEKQLQAWIAHYSKYKGGNGDPLPQGAVNAMLDSGVMSDGWVNGDEDHPVTNKAYDHLAQIFGKPFGDLEAEMLQDVMEPDDQLPRQKNTNILGYESSTNESKKGKKPDFLDADKDGNKKEPFKKALKDKKKKSKKKVAETGTDTSKAERQAKELAKAYAPDRFGGKSKKKDKKKTNEGKIDFSAILPETEVITESADPSVEYIVALATRDVSTSSTGKQSSSALDLKKLAGL